MFILQLWTELDIAGMNYDYDYDYDNDNDKKQDTKSFLEFILLCNGHWTEFFSVLFIQYFASKVLCSSFQKLYL